MFLDYWIAWVTKYELGSEMFSNFSQKYKKNDLGNYFIRLKNIFCCFLQQATKVKITIPFQWKQVHTADPSYVLCFTVCDVAHR